jgi:hypothetical protein
MVQKMVRKMVVVVLIMVIMVMVNAPAFKSLSLTCSAVQVSTSGDELFLCLNVNQCFRDKTSPFSIFVFLLSYIHLLFLSISGQGTALRGFKGRASGP